MPTLPGIERLRPWVTCRDALSHLPIEELGRPVRLRWKPTDDHRPTTPDEPAKTLTRNTHSDGTLLVLAAPKKNHPISRPDEPAFVVKTNGGRASQAGSMMEIPERPSQGQRAADPDEPSPTITAAGRGQHAAVRAAQGMRVGAPGAPGATVTAKPSRVGAGEAHVLEWPWDRPATTVLADPRLPPTGHHEGSYMSPKAEWPWERPSTTVCAGVDKIAPVGEHSSQKSPNAIVLSERAAAILQGFPEGWLFAGDTKKARWSQIGQAMPPGLAEPVARAIVEQLAGWEREQDGLPGIT